MGLGALTFRFLIDKNLLFNYFSGYYVRSFFYATLKKADPVLAEKIHNSKSLSPFSSKALTVEHGGYRHIVMRRVEKQCSSYFSYSIFLPELFNKIVQQVMEEDTVTLLNESFSLSTVEVREVKWNSFLEASKPVKKFDILFITPTYFRLPPSSSERYDAKFKPISRKEKAPYRYYPLPDPSLLVKSVAKIWRFFSDTKTDLTSLVSWVGRGGVAISGFPEGLRTLRLYEHEKADKWVVGFVGRVGYSTPSDLFDENQARMLDALLRFSEYSNVGGGRTAGLGMVKYIPLEYAE